MILFWTIHKLISHPRCSLRNFGIFPKCHHSALYGIEERGRGIILIKEVMFILDINLTWLLIWVSLPLIMPKRKWFFLVRPPLEGFETSHKTWIKLHVRHWYEYGTWDWIKSLVYTKYITFSLEVLWSTKCMLWTFAKVHIWSITQNSNFSPQVTSSTSSTAVLDIMVVWFAKLFWSAWIWSRWEEGDEDGGVSHGNDNGEDIAEMAAVNCLQEF